MQRVLIDETIIGREIRQIKLACCRYYVRRFVRIAPAYYAMLLVIRGLVWVFGDSDLLPEYLR